MFQDSYRDSWLISLLGLCLLIASACATYEDYSRNVAYEEADENQKVQRTTMGKLDALSLVASLAQDAEKGVEPSGSKAYRVTLERARNPKEAARISPALLSVLRKKNPDAKSFLPLLALRRIDLETYKKEVDSKFRIAILTDALKHSPHFNVWGLPHLYWDEGAHAIIEDGQDAIPALVQLLDNKRPAPIIGSEAFAEFKRYRYRVCDYALALIIEILPDQFIPGLYSKREPDQIPYTPEMRDDMIHELSDKLVFP